MSLMIHLTLVLVTCLAGSGLTGANNINEKWADVAAGLDSVNAQKSASMPVFSDQPSLTATLVAWISSQVDGIIEEMEAIVRQNVEFDGFSVVNYLRFLNLYDSLLVVAEQPIDELKWARKKARVFNHNGVYESALQILNDYLTDVDARLTQIELAEPKGAQKAVSSAWLELYRNIDYIAIHAPETKTSGAVGLKERALEMLNSSPNGTSDKVRSTRYLLKTRAFSRR